MITFIWLRSDQGYLQLVAPVSPMSWPGRWRGHLALTIATAAAGL